MNTVFEKLSKHPLILVIGPQRSGTTIAGKMIARDTGLSYIDEIDFDVYNVQRFKEACKRGGVIQAPALTKHIIDHPTGFIVYMKRDVEDIKKSEERIGWVNHDIESRPFEKEGHHADLKWEYYQEHTPENSMVVEYESLSEHPLWINKDQRVKFGSKQTTI